MNSYLQTIKNLQLHHSHSGVLHEAHKYQNYQDFLHRRSKLGYNQPYLPHKNAAPLSQYPAQNHIEIKNKSQTVYYPLHRTEIQYHDRRYVQKIPKMRKVVEYIEKKETEIVPKQVVKTDYYAVQHQRTYHKQVVPEVKVQMVQVPKVIKNIEYVPKERQIIFYPNHLTDMKQIKEQAKSFLEKQGVSIKQDAQFRPLNTKITSLEANTNLSERLKSKIEQAELKLQKLQKMQMQEASRGTFHLFNRLKNHSKEFRSSRFSQKRESIPIYDKQKYENLSRHYVSKMNARRSYQEELNSSFAEKDVYRYNLAANSSIRSKY